MNKDFINIIREIRGSGAPGDTYTDGIWYELTIADKNGNHGVYGDILAKYGVVTESVYTLDKAVEILENLNVEVTTLPAGSQATSALVNGVWQIGIPAGKDGEDGTNGFTPEVAMSYNLGNLKYTVTVDGVEVTNSTLLNLDNLISTKVSKNVDVQNTLEAKQDVLDAVATAQGLSDSFEANVVTKKQEIDTYANTKINEISTQVELEKIDLGTHATAKVGEYNANALSKLNQYNDNHTDKLSTYNTNYSVKMDQYNENHIKRISEINYAYASRIVEMIKTRNFMGIMDEYVAKTDTHMITFIDTTDSNYIYYANGTLLVENVDYTVYDSKTIELTVKANPYDVIVQVNTQVLNDMLTSEGVLFEDRFGQPNGIASLNEVGQVPAEQLPSYVDDVLEFPTYADLPVEGETGKIYVVVTDETSKGDTSTYRWAGSIYVMVSNTLNDSDVKALYEANLNTNAYTDAEKSKLADIEDGATADQTASEIEALYESNIDTNKYTDAEKNRVDINTTLTTTAQTLPTAVNELDNRVANIEDNTTLAEYGITDAYTKTEVQETLPAVGLDITNTVAPTRPGQIKWNQNEGTLDLALNNGVMLQLGQENTRLVRNATLSAIPDMTVCMFDGTLGNSGRIKIAPFTGLFNQAHYIYGIATQSINAGEDGYITIDGKVRNVDTTGALVGEVWVDGDVLYAKPNDAGRLTKVTPADNELRMPIASVVHAHTNGTLEVRVLPFNENMIAKRADKWTTARTITLSGDVSGSASVDGSANVTITTTVQPNSVALGTDTTGNYVAGVTAGQGITISGTAWEGWSPTITNTAPNVTTDITTTHSATDVVVNSSDGTDGTINGATQTLAGVMTASDKAKLDGIEAGATGDQTASEILTLLKTVDGAASGLDADLLDGMHASSTNTVSTVVARDASGNFSAGTITAALSGNAGTATTLQTARTIGASGDVTGTATSFNGSADITIPMILANSGVTAGTYSKVTVDAKGRVTAASTQTMEDIPDATFKRSVRCATTANITLSGAQTIDDIAAVAGDRVLVKNQTTSSQNGIYVVNESNWTRSLDADTSTKISSALVAVDSGTVNGGKLFDNDFKTTDTLDTTAMTWSMNLDDGSLLTAGSTAIGMIKYNGTTATAGQFDGGTTTPTGSTRLNFGGYFYPTYINLTGSGDTTTASSHYYVETGSDGFIRPKPLANVRAEIITKAALLSADPYYFSSGVGTAGIAASTNYALFPASQDTLTLGIGTYNIIIKALVTVATSTVSATLLLNPKGAGTAIGTVFGKSFGSITNGGSPILTNVGSTTLGTAFTVTAASAVAGRAYNVVFEGILNISTAGTLIPSYSFSAALTSGVTTLNAANHIVIYKMTETSVTTAGGWV